MLCNQKSNHRIKRNKNIADGRQVSNQLQLHTTTFTTTAVDLRDPPLTGASACSTSMARPLWALSTAAGPGQRSSRHHRMSTMEGGERMCAQCLIRPGRHPLVVPGCYPTNRPRPPSQAPHRFVASRCDLDQPSRSHATCRMVADSSLSLRPRCRPLLRRELVLRGSAVAESHNLRGPSSRGDAPDHRPRCRARPAQLACRVG
jgi:hypothetical protein